MDMKKTLGAIVAGYIVQFGGSYLIHEIILKKDYMDTEGLWRPEADMAHRLWIMLLAQFIFTVGAVFVYQRGVEKRGWIGQGIRYGILLALVSIVPMYMINYVVINVPHSIALHQILLEGAHVLLLALVIAGICQPKSA